VLTFGVELFFGSVRKARTVREGLADSLCACCSSRVLRVLARLRFRSVGWVRFRTVRVCRADSPRVPSGQSACSPRTVRLSGFATGGSVGFDGQSVVQAGRSAVPLRTVRGTLADSPRGSCGQSAPPGRTVRPSWSDSPPEPGYFVPQFDSSLLSCFRVCFKESFLRLKVDP
jgi:hypothetical protein